MQPIVRKINGTYELLWAAGCAVLGFQLWDARLLLVAVAFAILAFVDWSIIPKQPKALLSVLLFVCAFLIPVHRLACFLTADLLVINAFLDWKKLSSDPLCKTILVVCYIVLAAFLFANRI
jgi:hypothetical protein